jgi:hypothetical protein
MDINNLNKFIISRTEKIDAYLNKVDDNINLLKVLNKALSSKSKSKISKINNLIGGSTQSVPANENLPADLEEKAKSISESKIQQSVTALVASIRSHHDAIKTTKAEFDKLRTALQKYKDELSAKAASSNSADAEKYDKLVRDTSAALEKVNDAIGVLSREENKTAVHATELATGLVVAPSAKGDGKSNTQSVPDAKGDGKSNTQSSSQSVPGAKGDGKSNTQSSSQSVPGAKGDGKSNTQSSSQSVPDAKGDGKSNTQSSSQSNTQSSSQSNTQSSSQSNTQGKKQEGKTQGKTQGGGAKKSKGSKKSRGSKKAKGSKKSRGSKKSKAKRANN